MPSERKMKMGINPFVVVVAVKEEGGIGITN
jgi:hypothetical protein